VLARANGRGAPLVLDARAGQLRFARGARDARGFDGVVRAPQPSAARRAPAAARSDSIARRHLDVELRQRLGHAFARRRGVLERMAQRGGD
jgi:hypothetical protein